MPSVNLTASSRRFCKLLFLFNLFDAHELGLREDLAGLSEFEVDSPRFCVKSGGHGLAQGDWAMTLGGFTGSDDEQRLQLIGCSAALRALRAFVTQVAASEATVLITGESGVGKEVIARRLHAQSPRASGPFVPVNCAAIPPDLLESELFGHKKGAFTGALADRRGRFELAEDGTLFLDEIGDMPMPMQVKLLRVLQERVIDPVGGSESVPVNIRVVAATHRELLSEVQAQRFREDLYYRLNVVPIEVPPLRQRIEDLPQLLQHLAAKHAPPGHAPVTFGPRLIRILAEYAWPGNVRELGNLVSRFTAVFPGAELEPEMIPEHLLPPALRGQKLGMAVAVSGLELDVNASQLALAFPSSVEGEGDRAPDNEVEQAILLGQGWTALPPDGLHLRDHLARIEAAIIRQALVATQGNVSQSSRLLRLQRTTLIEKINKYQLKPD